MTLGTVNYNFMIVCCRKGEVKVAHELN